MPTGIFLVPPRGELMEISELSFEREADFQELLARYPSLLVGDPVDPESPQRWLLVNREVDVPGEAARILVP